MNGTMEIGDGLEIRWVKVSELREQDINAQVMQPREFERLTENMRDRGGLESLPYCAQVNGGGVEIISGHHRVRAARAAGMVEIPVIVDSSASHVGTLSQRRAKQLAHNFLTGRPDDAVARRMLEEIDSVDDLLASGAPDDMLPIPAPDPTLLRTPHADFDWKAVSFVFLPHQLEGFKELVSLLDGQQDLVGLAELPAFSEFAKAISSYSRVKEIRSVGTAVSALARIALDRVAIAEANADVDQWVKLDTVLGTDAIPATAAAVILEAIDKAVLAGDTSLTSIWRLLELWAADYLAAA